MTKTLNLGPIGSHFSQLWPRDFFHRKSSLVTFLSFLQVCFWYGRAGTDGAGYIRPASVGPQKGTNLGTGMIHEGNSFSENYPFAICL